MALRDKLRERAQQHLEPGEQVHQVFLAQTGPNPWMGALTTIIAFWTKHYVVAVTDRRIAFLQAGAWSPSKPKSVATWADRRTQLGPLEGLWGKMEVNGTRYFVHKRFHKDVAEADAALAATGHYQQPQNGYQQAQPQQAYPQQPAYPQQAAQPQAYQPPPPPPPPPPTVP